MEAAISSVALGLLGDPLLFDEDSAQLSIIEKSSICPDGCLNIVIPGGWTLLMDSRFPIWRLKKINW